MGSTGSKARGNGKGAIAARLLISAPLGFCAGAYAQSADDANKSNNPLNLAASLNFQNYYTPRLFGTNAHTNDFLVRPTIPIAPGDWVGAVSYTHLTLPTKA